MFIVFHHENILYNLNPFKPHFYIVKLGFTGVYIIFRIFARKHRLWILVRNRLAEAVLTSTHNLCFEQKYEKYQSFLTENFQFSEVKIFYIFEYACFRNEWHILHIYSHFCLLFGLALLF